jgi:hypothetical protein
MPGIRVFQERKLLLDFVTTKNKFYSQVIGSRIVSRIRNVSFSARGFKETNGFHSTPKNIQRNVIVKEELPFRVKFSNKKFSQYGPNNPAPIGIAVVGLNNYIL